MISVWKDAKKLIGKKRRYNMQKIKKTLKTQIKEYETKINKYKWHKIQIKQMKHAN